MFKRILALLLLSFFASCVPSKDLIYFQGEPLDKKEIYKLNDQPYRLQVDDVLSINITSNDEEFVKLFRKAAVDNQNNVRVNGFEAGVDPRMGYRVDQYGNIRIPYIGEINVLGFTTQEVRKKLDKLVLEYIKDGDNFFITVDLTGIRYTTIGELVNPGPKLIYQNRVSIVEAIANSGDITITGDKRNVELIRNNASGLKKYTIDLTSIDAFSSEVYYIQSNDIINVIPLKQKAWGTGTSGLQSLSTVVSVVSLITSTVLLIKSL